MFPRKETMAIIFVVYMTVWKTFFALYMINNMHHAEKTPWLTFGVLFYQVGHKGRDFKHSLLIYPQKEK